jgi:uncharacterized membrane-anchored protein YjiN (DUF445 family)
VNRAPIEIETSQAPATELTVTSGAEGAIDPRPAALRRMRLIATLLLVGMAAVFVATTATHLAWPWIPYVRAFAEAGMVGACADWFAVVALFRRPLGLPIPHTGIVPANKDRIGKALGRFITNNFLTAAVMNERMARVDIVGSFARWVGEPANAKRLAHYTTLFLPRISRSLPSDRIGETLGQLVQQALAAIPAAPLASKMLAVIWAHGEAQTLLAQAIDYSAQWLAANKDYLTLKIAQQSSRWIPKWIDKMIAEKVLNGMLSTLAEMRNPAHPWRVEMRKSVEKLIADLASDPDMRVRIDAMKSELLANPLLVEQAVGRDRDRTDVRIAGTSRRRRQRHRECAARHRLLAAGGCRAQGADQPANSRRHPAVFVALSRRDRRLHRARGAQLGQRHAGRPAGAAGRQGSAVYPHQRHAGRWPGRAVDLHRLEVDRRAVTRDEFSPKRPRWHDAPPLPSGERVGVRGNSTFG